MRLTEAPGDLGGVELEVLGWRTEEGETALICRLPDGEFGDGAGPLDRATAAAGG